MEEVKDLNDIQSSESEESTNVHDDNFRVSTNDRLMEVYVQINNDPDVAAKLAALLTTTNYFNWANKISNEINGRQGKNRLTITDSTSQLMKYSLDTDVDEILDQRLIDIEIDVLNTYLADKYELPTNQPARSQAIINRVKALMIMLTATNQYGLIPKLNLPPYILSMVSDLFNHIQSIKNDILQNWIDWLNENGNEEMAEIVKSAGNEFWGSEGIKANVIYDRYFGHMIERINKPKETYDKYLEFRLEYRKNTKNILPSRIYEIFHMTKNSYRKHRENVIREISELFPEEDNKNVIQRLIYEQ
jgi:hypothetical protein